MGKWGGGGGAGGASRTPSIKQHTMPLSAEVPALQLLWQDWGIDDMKYLVSTSFNFVDIKTFKLVYSTSISLLKANDLKAWNA